MLKCSLTTSNCATQMAMMSPFAGGGVASSTHPLPPPPHHHPQPHHHHQMDLAHHRGMQHQQQQQQHEQQPEAHRLQHYRSLPGPAELSPIVPDGGALHLHQAPGSPNFASSRSLPGLHDFSEVRRPPPPAQPSNGRLNVEPYPAHASKGGQSLEQILQGVKHPRTLFAASTDQGTIECDA